MNSRRRPESLPLSASPHNLHKHSQKSAEFTGNLQHRSKQSESEAVVGGARGKSEVCQVAEAISALPPSPTTAVRPRFEAEESGERASRPGEAPPAVGVSGVLAIVQRKSDSSRRASVQFVK